MQSHQPHGVLDAALAAVTLTLIAVTLHCDALKGTAAVLLAAYFAGHQAALIAGLGAFLGHLSPVWLRFKGGKGVATYIGLLIGLAWPGALTPISLWALGGPGAAALFLLLTVLLWITRRTNIARLLDGSEGKIGAKA